MKFVTMLRPATRDVAADLGDIERRLIEVLEANPGVRFAYLFGSAARGEPFRDLDVGVMLAPEELKEPLPSGAFSGR